MFLKEFETKKEKFEKIQSYLRENFKLEIAENALSIDKADRLIERSENRLKSINQFSNPKEYSKLKLISEGLKIWKLNEEEDSDMDEARVILSVEEITTKLQDMIEKIAELQVQKLIPIIDKMKEELGANEAARFNEIADSSLGELLNVAKTTKDKISSAITSMSNGMSDMQGNVGMPSPDEGDTEIASELGSDEFGGDEAVSGEIGPEGRQMKGESINFEDALLSLKENSKDGKISKDKFNKIIGKK